MSQSVKEETFSKKEVPARKTSQSDKRKEKSDQPSPSKRPVFSRTNRIQGQTKWIRELRQLRFYLEYLQLEIKQDSSVENLTACSRQVADQITFIVDIGKELLYSGIPEQVIMLYSSYCELLGKYREVDAFPQNFQLPDARLVIVTIRAFIAYRDVYGALELLQLCSRVGLIFDSESKSLILSDLAVSSSAGLKAALHLRKSMIMRNESMNSNACASLLHGLYLYGLTSTGFNPMILADEVDAMPFVESSTIYDKTYETALNIMEYITSFKPNKLKRYSKVTREYLRLLFRLSEPTASQVDSNFVDDTKGNLQLQSIQGLQSVFNTMSQYAIDWDIHLADILIQGCMELQDLPNVLNILETMQIKKLVCRTSTCNIILQKYADVGDADNALKLYNLMKSNRKFCSPNEESHNLVLEACQKTQAGMYLADIILNELIETDSMNKGTWDKYLFHLIRQGKSALQALAMYPINDIQMNDDTIKTVIDAYLSSSDSKKLSKELIQVFELMVLAEETRLAYMSEIASKGTLDDNSTQVLSLEEFAVLNLKTREEYVWILCLPRPSTVITTKLLEYLKRHDMVDSSVSVLKKFTSLPQLTSIVATFDGTGKKLLKSQGYLFKDSMQQPYFDMFAIAMETCISANQPLDAFQVFHMLEVFLQQYAVVEEESRYNISLSATDGDDFSVTAASNITANKSYVLPRRIYRNLMMSFGLNDDLVAATAVFQEMLSYHLPDIETLFNLVRLCQRKPANLRKVINLLESLASDPRINLDIYSKDLLLQAFPDGITLGKALTAMETRAWNALSDSSDCKDNFLDNVVLTEPISASITVLNVLVQTIRKDTSLESLIGSLLYLGSLGIKPDEDTMEYFRMGTETIEIGSPNSRHVARSLNPHRERVRSLMDIEVPSQLKTDLRLIDDIVKSEGIQSKDLKSHRETEFDEYRVVVESLTNCMRDYTFDILEDDALDE